MWGYFIIFIIQVERAIATINSALANQIDWEEIEEVVQEAKSQSDPVANVIKKLKLDTNQLVLSLTYEKIFTKTYEFKINFTELHFTVMKNKTFWKNS